MGQNGDPCAPPRIFIARHKSFAKMTREILPVQIYIERNKIKTVAGLGLLFSPVYFQQRNPSCPDDYGLTVFSAAELRLVRADRSYRARAASAREIFRKSGERARAINHSITRDL